MTTLILKEAVLEINSPECPCNGCQKKSNACEWCDEFMEWFEVRKDKAHDNSELSGAIIDSMMSGE